MIDVSCAIIRNEDYLVLVVQRGPETDHPFKWEFPGGKVDRGESPEDSVIREVSEELDMDIVIVGTLGSVEHDYGHKQIRLIPFVCDTLHDKPVLNEHNDWKWVSHKELLFIDLAEADVIVATDYVAGIDHTTDRAGEEDISVTRAPEIAGSETVSDEELKGMVYRMMGSSEVGWIASSAASNPVLFRKLIDFTEDRDPRIVFRSSWALTKVCDTNPSLFIDYLHVIVSKLLVCDNESAKRSFLKILTLTGTSSLGETDRGQLTELCFSLLKTKESAIAVKAYSMDVLYEISHDYPDIIHELAAALSMIPDDGSAGIKSKSRSLLKKLTGTRK
jgi:8-oxo-dGTP diphosphatase